MLPIISFVFDSAGRMLFDNIIMTSVSVFAAFTGIYFLMRLKLSGGKLPPISSEGTLETVAKFQDVTAIHWLLSLMRQLGPVFRIRLPDLQQSTVVIGDPSLSRMIFDEHEEKSKVYKNFDGVSNGVPTLFTKRTFHGGWDFARKGVAPSFSMANINKALPKVYKKLDELHEILSKYVSTGAVFDMGHLMILLTVDFITTTMFDVEYNALSDKPESEGLQLLNATNIVLKEYALKQMFNPIRFLFFWNKEILEAQKASKYMFAAQQKILDNYRATKSAEEIENDTSILGHLVLSPYPSDKERCADMVIFFIAGHDTTGYTLAWIIIEIAKHPEVLHRIKQEIDEKIPIDVTHLSPSHLSSLTYLDWVIKEGMRLWPVAALGSSRESNRDITYKNYVIPKNTTLSINMFLNFRSDTIQVRILLTSL